MRPQTSSQLRRRRARRRATKGVPPPLRWRKPVGTYWPQPAAQPAHLQGVQVRGGAGGKGARTRSRRKLVRKCRFTPLQQRRHAQARARLRQVAWRSAYAYTSRTGLAVARKDRKGKFRIGR